jgi:hypothetical protein
MEETGKAWSRAKAQVRKRLISIDIDGEREGRTRLDLELPEFAKILDCCILGSALSFLEYMSIDRDELLHRARTEHIYAVCSPAEAKMILQQACPAIPLVIPAATNAEARRLDLLRYLEYLTTKEALEFHRFDQITSNDALVYPDSERGEVAVYYFLEETIGEINFLSLEGFKGNPIPACIADVPAYSVLLAKAKSGKALVGEPDDLNSSASFQILGKKGAFSLPHRDRHHVLTTIFNDHGEKLWLAYPRLEREALISWVRGQAASPEASPFPLFLQSGDLLIQPPGTIHTPYSMTDVLMTGTMHWDSRQMVEILRETQFERHYPTVTNEDWSIEFCGKIDYIKSLWEGGRGIWPWPKDEGALHAFQALYQVSS